MTKSLRFPLRSGSAVRMVVEANAKATEDPRASNRCEALPTRLPR